MKWSSCSPTDSIATIRCWRGCSRTPTLTDPGFRGDTAATPRGELKTSKIDQAGAILAGLPVTGGGEVRLDEEAAEAWLRALNDVRLALAVRLDLVDETSLESELDDAVLRDPTSARVYQLSVYAYLGYLQESLLEALTSA